MRLFLSLCLVFVATLAVSCGESLECNAENHCYFDEGEVACESGYQWADPNAADDYRCEKIPRIDIPVLGNGAHTATSVNLTVIVSASEGLNTPRDVAFHPTVPGMLWVVNRGDTSMVILSDVGTPSQRSVKKQALSGGGLHFMAEPSALAFADGGNFGTIHETDKLTQGPVSQGGTPRDFMGPTLWSSDLNVFNAGHAGHLDMMHNSPLGMGIAWERDNVYWIFDGYHSSITRYDFGHDHGPGGTYHDDGVISRYVEGQVKRTPDVVSHLEFDPATRLLYIADTGNHRVATLAIGSGTRGQDLPSREVYDCFQHPGRGVTCADYHSMDGATLQTLVNGPDHGISQPSGLALHGDFVYVSDFATGTISAFNKDGLLMDWLETGRPQSLGGIEFDSQGNLYIADTGANEILRISPL